VDVQELIRTFVPGGPVRMAHQQQALQDVIRNKGSHALLMDMGTGKTAVVWDYLSLLALRYGECRVLVVCPKVVRDSWGQQGLKFAHPQVSLWCETLTGLRMDKAKRLQALGVDTAMRMHTEKPEVTLRDAGNPHVRVNPRSLGPGAMRAPRVVMAIANYDTFSSRARHGSKTMADVMLAAVGKFNPHIVVADEGHYARNPSNIGRFMARLGRGVPRRLLLTGTPMPHSPIDILQQWHFVDPDEFVTDHGRPWGRPYFLERYAVLGGWQGKEVIRWRGLDHLQARIAKRATVVSKEDALDLPPITEVVHRFALSSKERGAYRDMAKRMVVSLEAGELTEDNRLVQMLRLRQITSGFVHDTGTGKDEILGTSKLDAAVEILDDVMAGESRAVVFCWSRLEMARLAERFGRGRLWDAQPLLISGQTKDADRKAILERFLNVKANPEKIVVIAQIRTVSVGINEFVSASNVLFLSLSQQREEFLQARDRLHRIGQEKPVTVHVLLAKNSVDGQIWRHYQQRTDLEASILDHVRQVGRSQTMTEGIDVQEGEDGER
jgi:SNF2 family DNA or RNA helicase